MFELHRVAVLRDGAFGGLLHNGFPFAVTLERTYDELDEATVSTKIPLGRFHCTRSVFLGGGYSTFEIHVPGHSRILFHKGNVEEDSEGCVIVAENFGELRGAPAVLDSAGGFREFMRRASGVSGFELMVTERRSA